VMEPRRKETHASPHCRTRLEQRGNEFAILAAAGRGRPEGRPALRLARLQLRGDVSYFHFVRIVPIEDEREDEEEDCEEGRRLFSSLVKRSQLGQISDQGTPAATSIASCTI
jgi:hypothetical protein